MSHNGVGANQDKAEPDRKLLESAATALAQNPRASMSAIAQACGIGRATLNRRFSSRQDLMRAIAMDAMNHLDEITKEASVESSAQAFLRRILPSLISLGDRFRVLDQDPELLEVSEIQQALERQRKESIALSRSLKEENALDHSVPDAFFAAALDGLLFSTWTAIADGHLAPNDAPNLIFRTLFTGLGPEGNSGKGTLTRK